MDMNELVQMGASLFSNSKLSGDAGSNLDLNKLSTALSDLTGGDKNFNLPALLDNLKAGGLGDIAKSWLGDGDNAPVSPEQVSQAIGSEKVEAFAKQLGISPEEAAGGLSEALPKMIDKASSGGSLLESIGGIEGALGFASKFFAK